VSPSKTLAEDEVRRVLRCMDADVQASLALTRAALQALAALSPAMHRAADLALEEEVERAERTAAPQQVVDIVSETRLRLQEAPEEARAAKALEQALVKAAESLRAAAA
jgi:hypothetical protein